MALVITYNGVTKNAEEGKTATLACAGKVMLSDVVITVKNYTVKINSVWPLNVASNGTAVYVKDGYDETVSPTNYDITLGENEYATMTVKSGYLSVYAYSGASLEKIFTYADARKALIVKDLEDPACLYSQYNLDANGSWKGVFEITQDIPNYYLGCSDVEDFIPAPI